MCVIPVLMGKSSESSTTECNVSCGCLLDALEQVEGISFGPWFVVSFIFSLEGMLNCNCFSSACLWKEPHDSCSRTLKG